MTIELGWVSSRWNQSWWSKAREANRSLACDLSALRAARYFAHSCLLNLLYNLIIVSVHHKMGLLRRLLLDLPKRVLVIAIQFLLHPSVFETCTMCWQCFWAPFTPIFMVYLRVELLVMTSICRAAWKANLKACMFT